MTTPARAARVNSAVQVIQRMQEGMTIVDACQEVGLPRSTFYDIVKNNPEAIAKIQELVDATSREQLGMILLNNTEILGRIIQDGLSKETAPRDRLAIYKTLNKLVTELADTLREESKAIQPASPHGSIWPKMKVVKSRFSATQETITLERDE